MLPTMLKLCPTESPVHLQRNARQARGGGLRLELKSNPETERKALMVAIICIIHNVKQAKRFKKAAQCISITSSAMQGKSGGGTC